MTKKNVIIVLHGGLGNQLFQLFRGLTHLVEFPDYGIIFNEYFLNKYSVKREFELDPIASTSLSFRREKTANFFIKFRMAKVIKNIFSGKDFIISIINNHIIIDGYFQNKSDYQKIQKKTINEAIILLRKFTNENFLNSMKSKKEIHHIRLTDFFKNRNEATIFVSSYLKKITKNIDIITDDEDLLCNEIKKNKLAFNINIIPTKNFSSWELLKILSNYGVVNSNGSSLAFWGALLSGSILKTSNNEHQELFEFLNEI